MDIAVYKLNNSIIVIQIQHYDRHGIQTGKLACFQATMACNKLISTAFLGTGDCRNENAELFDALDQFLHSRIIPNSIGIFLVGVEVI